MIEKKKERKYCQNCGKPIETGFFCSDECGKIYYREPVGSKPLDKCQTLPQNDDDAPNKGTEAKKLLQEQAIKCMQKYPKNLTKKQYACMLCWDIRVSQRTALESYIEPMIAHAILVPSGKGRYHLSPEYE